MKKDQFSCNVHAARTYPPNFYQIGSLFFKLQFLTETEHDLPSHRQSDTSEDSYLPQFQVLLNYNRLGGGEEFETIRNVATYRFESTLCYICRGVCGCIAHFRHSPAILSPKSVKCPITSNRLPCKCLKGSF